MRGGLGGSATDSGDLVLGRLVLGGCLFARGSLGLVGSIVGRLVVGLAQGGGRLRGRHDGGERGLRILGHLACGVLVCGGEQGSKGILAFFRLVRGGLGLLVLLVRRGGGRLVGSGVLCGSLHLGRLLSGGLVGGLGLLGRLCGRSVGLG